MATLPKLALTCCGLVMLGILPDAGGRTALAQSNVEAPNVLAHDRPSFEVASVRAAPGRDPFFIQMRPPRALAGGLFEATATLRSLIQWAFRPGFPIEGSFSELDDEFVIVAKAPGPVLLADNYTVGPVNQMLQSLLAERFKLRVRWETRRFPVYALRRTTTEQLGRNLKRLDVTCPASYPETISAAPEGCMSRVSMRKGQVSGVVRSISEFARMLSIFTGRRVVDDTGLVGPFELSTEFDFRSETGSSPFPGNTEHLPTLRDALRRDLGLKLEAGERGFPVLIVEHVEQPSGN